MFLAMILLFSMPLCARASTDIDLSRLYSDLAESCRDPLVMFSSNPYDYIENNPAYEAIIRQGVKILPELEGYLAASGKSGLEEYLFAIAIEQITACNLKAYEDTKWESASTFLDAWVPFRKSVPSEIRKIEQSGLSQAEKRAKISKYGILSLPYATANAQTRSAGSDAMSAEDIEFLRTYIESD